MSSTDCLQPPLTSEEHAVVKSYGGWTAFSHSMGLKPYDMDDNAEAKTIVQSFVAHEREAQAAKSSGGKKK